MTHEARELQFLATPEKGEVSCACGAAREGEPCARSRPWRQHEHAHATLQNIAARMAEIGIATFRYNFPYMEHGKGRDSQEVCTTTVRSAVAAAHQATVDLPVLAGGHSFGGRMTSTSASQGPLDRVHGLVFFAFPLHQPGKPDTKAPPNISSM